MIPDEAMCQTYPESIAERFQVAVQNTWLWLHRHRSVDCDVCQCHVESGNGVRSCFL